jgi:hypothetical protein
MNRARVPRPLAIFFLLPFLFLACNTKQAVPPNPTTPTIPPETPKTPTWTMTVLLKDWLLTPHDLAIKGEEIYVGGTFENKVAVLDLQGQVRRYYTIDKGADFGNVLVAITSQGRVFAASSLGIWELNADGTTKRIAILSATLEHLTAGPDDNLYLSNRLTSSQSKITKMTLSGSSSDYLNVDSNRVSDLAFSPNGDLYMADAQYGRILRYSPALGLQVFSSGFAPPGAGGAFYFEFDPIGRFYLCSSWTNLCIVSSEGALSPLGVYNFSGDIVFFNGLLYGLDQFTSKLIELRVSGTTVLSQRLVMDGVVPWYIDHQGDVIVGSKGPYLNRWSFFNFSTSPPISSVPNAVLNSLQPHQYTFDEVGNIFVRSGNLLKKLDATGKEIYKVTLPGTFPWNSRLFYRVTDGRIYYFDPSTNSIIRANADGAETYHRFASKVDSACLALANDGKVYAAYTISLVASVVDISDPSQERLITTFTAQNGVELLYIGVDGKGYLYSAMGPVYHKVVRIDPATGAAVSLIGSSSPSYDWGFVDPQGFHVMDSGTVYISAPGLLIKFVPDA